MHLGVPDASPLSISRLREGSTTRVANSSCNRGVVCCKPHPFGSVNRPPSLQTIPGPISLVRPVLRGSAALFGSHSLVHLCVNGCEPLFVLKMLLRVVVCFGVRVPYRSKHVNSGSACLFGVWGSFCSTCVGSIVLSRCSSSLGSKLLAWTVFAWGLELSLAHNCQFDVFVWRLS